MIFQNHYLNPRLTAKENVMLPLFLLQNFIFFNNFYKIKLNFFFLNFLCVWKSIFPLLLYKNTTDVDKLEIIYGVTKSLIGR